MSAISRVTSGEFSHELVYSAGSLTPSDTLQSPRDERPASCLPSQEQEISIERKLSDQFEKLVSISQLKPFPGKGAEFVLDKSRWEDSLEVEQAPLLKKIMVFSSAHKDSLLSKVCFFGYTNGTIKLSVLYDAKHNDCIKEYFSMHGVDVRVYALSTTTFAFCTHTKDETKNVCDLALKHNTFPAGYDALIQSLMAAGD